LVGPEASLPNLAQAILSVPWPSGPPIGTRHPREKPALSLPNGGGPRQGELGSRLRGNDGCRGEAPPRPYGGFPLPALAGTSFAGMTRLSTGRGKESRGAKQVTRFGCALFLESAMPPGRRLHCLGETSGAELWSAVPPRATAFTERACSRPDVALTFRSAPREPATPGCRPEGRPYLAMAVALTFTGCGKTLSSYHSEHRLHDPTAHYFPPKWPEWR
jgi:hypothetical protein